VASQANRFQKVPFELSVSTRVSCHGSASSDAANSAREESETPASSNSSIQKNQGKGNQPERRTYMGAVYEKGEDGQWHLQHE
jgi:hypothetical protein